MALDCYVGEDFVNNIYVGDKLVNMVYKGDQLVYARYKPNEIILESSAPLNKDIYLMPGYYEVIFIGAGGGSSGSGGGGSHSDYSLTTVNGEEGS